MFVNSLAGLSAPDEKGVTDSTFYITVKILKFGTPQTIAIIVLKIEKFAVILH